MNRIVVIPARNEVETIADIVTQCLEHEATAVVLADDGSTDGTALVARTAGAHVTPVPPRRKGLVGVYRCGLQHAFDMYGADALYCELDAGGSHDPRQLGRFWDALDLYDVAAGERFRRGRYEGKWQRKLLSWVGTQITNLLHGTSYADATSGYIAYRGEALEALLAKPLRSTGHYYQTEVRLLARAEGLLLTEVPIVYRNSSSSLNWRSIREALSLVVR